MNLVTVGATYNSVRERDAQISDPLAYAIQREAEAIGSTGENPEPQTDEEDGKNHHNYEEAPIDRIAGFGVVHSTLHGFSAGHLTCPARPLIALFRNCSNSLGQCRWLCSAVM
jgi:hypothetical protein